MGLAAHEKVAGIIYSVRRPRRWRTGRGPIRRDCSRAGGNMSIRGVLFDKDGTLIDVNGTWVPIYRQMLREQFDTDLPGPSG